MSDMNRMPDQGKDENKYDWIIALIIFVVVLSVVTPFATDFFSS